MIDTTLLARVIPRHAFVVIYKTKPKTIREIYARIKPGPRHTKVTLFPLFHLINKVNFQ